MLLSQYNPLIIFFSDNTYIHCYVKQPIIIVQDTVYSIITVVGSS